MQVIDMLKEKKTRQRANDSLSLVKSGLVSQIPLVANI